MPVTGPGQITLAMSHLVMENFTVTHRGGGSTGGSQYAVTHRPQNAPTQSQLILSLFPGIDLLGRGFEAEGFTVVRGPDLIYGGDIRNFRVPAHRFDGVIGGPPCQDFSRARRCAPSGVGREMLDEFIRIVNEAAPAWWLMENVPSVPDVKIKGYTHQRIDLNAREVGLPQNRHRHFQFGSRNGLVLSVVRRSALVEYESCCLATEGRKLGRRDWDRFCRLQGLSGALELPGMTLAAKYRAVGNGVPVTMARALACAIVGLKDDIRVCGCGCGRPIEGRAVYALAACRKRMQRRRDLPGVDNFQTVTT